MVEKTDLAPPAQHTKSTIESSQPGTSPEGIIASLVRKALDTRQKLDDQRICVYMSKLDEAYKRRVIDYVENLFLGKVTWHKEGKHFVLS